MGNIPFNSSSNAIIGITSLRDCDKAMYSLSVVDRLISVWSFDIHIIGQLAYFTTYPVLENTEVGSSLHDLFHYPANEASTFTSTDFDSSTFIMRP